MSTTKKRHHYIPQTYLEGFCVSDEVPRVLEYRKHDGTPPRLDTPYNLAVERYYYAFDKEGGKDTNTLEDMFSIAEAQYKDIVARVMNREIFYPEDIDNLATFIAFMRVRVPNFRMQYEQGRAELSKITAMVASKHDKELNEKHAALVAAAEAKGDIKAVEALHRVKQEMERGEITVSVNPQISLVAIDYFRGIYERLKQLKWGFFTSDCGQDFITGDNPTLWHDTKIKDFFPYRNGYANPDVQFVIKNCFRSGDNFPLVWFQK